MIYLGHSWDISLVDSKPPILLSSLQIASWEPGQIRIVLGTVAFEQESSNYSMINSPAILHDLTKTCNTRGNERWKSAKGASLIPTYGPEAVLITTV